MFHLCTLWTPLNVCARMRLKDLSPPPSSVYKRMDTIKGCQGIKRIDLSVYEPTDRHKRYRYRQWQRGEMKQRKAVIQEARGSLARACTTSCGQIILFLTSNQQGKDVAFISVHFLYCLHSTLHIYCMIGLKLNCNVKQVIALSIPS